jgi:hypothetical protein
MKRNKLVSIINRSIKDGDRFMESCKKINKVMVMSGVRIHLTIELLH